MVSGLAQGIGPARRYQPAERRRSDFDTIAKDDRARVGVDDHRYRPDFDFVRIPFLAEARKAKGRRVRYAASRTPRKVSASDSSAVGRR